MIAGGGQEVLARLTKTERGFGCTKEAITETGEELLVVAADMKGWKPVAFAPVHVGSHHRQHFFEENKPGTADCPKLEEHERKELSFSEGNKLILRDVSERPDGGQAGPPLAPTEVYVFRLPST